MAVFENSTPTKRMQIKMTWMAMNYSKKLITKWNNKYYNIVWS